MGTKFVRQAALIIGVCIGAGYGQPADEIHRAVKSGDLATVVSLLDRDERVLDARNDVSKTPLIVAAESGSAEIAEFLIQRGADVNAVDSDNQSPLHYAAQGGHPEIVGLLLDQGAGTINDTSRSQHGGIVGGWTPLHLATLDGHPDVVELLLGHGANIEARDGAQRTPLILAAESGNLAVANILIDGGADINAEAIRGYTALLNGVRCEFREYVDLLIAKKARISPEALPRTFSMAVEAGMESLFRYVVDLGCNVEELRQQDPDLIFPAAAGGSVEIVRTLVDLGFDPARADPNGFAPIHAAASEGRIDVIHYLAGIGMDFNVRNKKGESAFNTAVLKGLDEVAAHLKELGADSGAPVFPTLLGPYMGQEPPGDTPQLFLPGIVSGYDRAHSSLTFSPDALEAYWTEMIPPEGRVAHMRVKDGKWTYPVTADLDRDPTFSPDGNRLYFIKTRPFREGEVPGGDPDLKEEYWYKEKTDSGWSAPISVGDVINVIGVHWPCSMDRQGNLYFSEFADNMYCSRYVDGAYTTPVRLTEFLNNATLVGRSPFIAPDGSYLLFSARDGLNISFLKEDGTWTDRIILGGEINASHENGSPRITADGKYMFFVSAGRGRPWGIYWVSADFIDRLRAEHLSDLPE